MFAREYVKDFNITAASARVGMSKTTAYKYLSNECVTDLIESEMTKRATRTTLDMDRIIKELAMITQSDITDYFDNVGGRMLTFKDIHELPAEKTRCIQSMKETISALGGITYEIKLYDKLKAIQLVAQSLTTMIAQMREFVGMQHDNNIVMIDERPVRVLGAPNKAPTLLEWETQMKELAEHNSEQSQHMIIPDVIDAEYTDTDDNPNPDNFADDIVEEDLFDDESYTDDDDDSDDDE